MSLILSGTAGVSDVDGTEATPALRGTDTNTGIFFPAADTIAFAEGGTEVARFDSAGNLGIGTSSPGYKLQVNGFVGVTDGTSTVRLANSGGVGLVSTVTNHPLAFQTNDTERMRIDSSGNLTLRTGGSSNVTHTFTYNENGGEITLNDNTNTVGTLIDLSGAATRVLHTLSTGNQQIGLGGSATGVLQFMRAGYVEAARIDSSGNLLVGTTSTQDNSRVYSDNAGNRWCYIAQAQSQGGVYYYHSFRVSGVGPAGSITGNNTSTVAYNTSSDYRLKENIQPMTGALAKVAALKPVTYKWKVDGSDGQGFIAHELAEVCPDAVSGEKDAVNEDGSIKPQGIDTSFLVATLTAAIQELKAIVDAQAVEIAQLKGQA